MSTASALSSLLTGALSSLLTGDGCWHPTAGHSRLASMDLPVTTEHRNLNDEESDTPWHIRPSTPNSTRRSSPSTREIFLCV
ncbi:hypothetical protein ACFPRL_13175 [Pseudoclavibacter helvolus]